MNPTFEYGRAMGPQMMDRGFDGFGVVVAIGFVIVAAIVVALLIWAAARKSGTAQTVEPSALPGSNAAVEIARERLARGEIDADQYIAVLTALRT